MKNHMLSAAVKRLAERLGSQAKIAKELNVTTAAVSQWAHGKNISIENAYRLSEMSNVPLDLICPSVRRYADMLVNENQEDCYEQKQ